MRTPLQVQPLTDGLTAPWTRLELVPESASTNADLTRAAVTGSAGPWSVLVAEHQSAGRGRLGRTWTTTPGTALTFSALVPAPEHPGWVPLITGLSLAEAIADRYATRPELKWPNDLLAPAGTPVAGRKLAGILCELTTLAGGEAAVVIGIGLNVDQDEAELPVPTATSLRALTGSQPAGLTREDLLLDILDRLATRLTDWVSEPQTVRAAYRSGCATVGRQVRVDLGVGEIQEGTALAIDDSGCLVVDLGGEVRSLAAGDVTHVRPA